MIDLCTVNPLTLPLVALEQRSKLPVISCIYFVIDSGGVIQYIGRSANLRQRWANHHRLEQLEQLEAVKIAWLEVSDESLLPSLESALIAYFSPVLNRATCYSCHDTPIKVTFAREFPGLGAKIKEQRIASNKQLAQLAADADISVPHWNRIENEKVKVLPEETLKGIEKALGVSLGASLGKKGEANND